MESNTGAAASAPLIISKSDRNQLAKDIAKAYVDAYMKSFKPTTDSDMVNMILLAGETVEGFDANRKNGLKIAATDDGNILGDAISEVICDFLEKHCASASSTTI
jgi:hypothetical protein